MPNLADTSPFLCLSHVLFSFKIGLIAFSVTSRTVNMTTTISNLPAGTAPVDTAGNAYYCIQILQIRSKPTRYILVPNSVVEKHSVSFLSVLYATNANLRPSPALVDEWECLERTWLQTYGTSYDAAMRDTGYLWTLKSAQFWTF